TIQVRVISQRKRTLKRPRPPKMASTCMLVSVVEPADSPGRRPSSAGSACWAPERDLPPGDQPVTVDHGELVGVAAGHDRAVAADEREVTEHADAVGVPLLPHLADQRVAGEVLAAVLGRYGLGEQSGDRLAARSGPPEGDKLGLRCEALGQRGEVAIIDGVAVPGKSAPDPGIRVGLA